MANKNNFSAYVLAVFLLIISSVINAKPLYIEVTGGQNVGIPIAVLPFAGSTSKELEDIAAVIRNDLQNCGHFQSLDVQNIDQIPSNTVEINHGYWKNFGAANLVFGKITSVGRGLYNVNFELVDIYKENKIPLLNMQFSNKNPDDFRALAHYISDLIFKKITGVRGFFSTRIAYITVDRFGDKMIQSLTVADSDGYNDKQLITVPYPLMTPRWSPDGKKIAFVSFKGHRSSVNIVNIIQGKIEVVTKFPGINGAPAWSPDGKKLALVLSKDGAPNLYVIDLASRELRQLTSGGSINTEPFWHPDGNSILFTSNRGGKPQIYRVILPTGDVQRVTYEGNYNATPSLTPDGKQLIMLHQSEKGAYNIAVQSLDTGKVKVITSASLDESPTLAPNGMMVLYGMRETNQNVLGAVTLDGKFRMRIPVQDGNVKEPSWSPFLLEDWQ
jgi:TolB protein